METTAIVSAAQLEALTTAVTDNVTVLLPVGLTIMGAMIGISLIPRIVYKFF